MADRAVLEARRAQIVKRRRHHADGLPVVFDRWADWRGIPGRRSALPAASASADSPSHAAHGRSRSLRSAPGACSNVNGPRLSPWQLKQPGSLAAKACVMAGPDAAVRIVAVDAGHRAFRQLVMIRPLELRPDVDMAARALFVDRRRLARHQPAGPLA